MWHTEQMIHIRKARVVNEFRWRGLFTLAAHARLGSDAMTSVNLKRRHYLYSLYMFLCPFRSHAMAMDYRRRSVGVKKCVEGNCAHHHGSIASHAGVRFFLSAAILAH